MVDKEQAKKIVPLLDRLKSLFQEEAAPVVEVKYSDAELEDGTKLKIEGELAQGSKALIVAEDGSEMPAPSGEHKLKDGSTITIIDGGIIEAVKPAEEKAPETVNEFKAEESYNSLKAELEAQKNLFAEMQSKFAELLGTNQKLSTDLQLSKQIQSETFNVVKLLADMPAEKPLETKEKFMSTKVDRLLALKDTIKEINLKSKN